jgi:hypothetical protein
MNGVYAGENSTHDEPSGTGTWDNFPRRNTVLEKA